MRTERSLLYIVLLLMVAATACREPVKETGGGLPASLAEVSAVRLNYRYEADVPAPTEDKAVQDVGINPAVQAAFSQSRPTESLVKTIASPDGKRVAAVYSRPADQPGDYRLDMYDAAGVVLRTLNSDLMAVHFPDTLRWSPDSSAIVFTAMLRTASAIPETTPTPESVPLPDEAAELPDGSGTDNSNTDTNTTSPPSEPTPEAPVGILAFLTDQLYLSDSDGTNTRPLTQNESLIYYYY
jgi:dipeptidyl aminopeptidase/acylaminoacyl peptidase